MPGHGSQRDAGGLWGPLGAPPGLLAWQVYLLCWAAGVWSLRHPEPALTTSALLWLGLVLFRRPGWLSSALSLLLAAACFAGGSWHAARALPPVPVENPALSALLDLPGKPLLAGRVAEVTDRPFGRLELLLEDVTALPPPPKGESGDAGVAGEEGQAANATAAPVPVPCRVAWDWDAPGFRPAPGQGVSVRLKLREVHGFANAGGADFEWRERLRGVFFRAYARGPEVEAVWGPRPLAAAWDAREELRARLIALLPDTQGGAIVLGLLLGDRSRIDELTTDDLRTAGLSHTLALSGLNVVYVAVLGLALAWGLGLAWPGLFLRIPRQKLAVLLSLPLVGAYVWLGQASPSLVRSAWMFAFWGLFLLLDRGRALLDGLFWALALMIGLDPLCVFDVGLQMSAAAVAGLAILLPWLEGFGPGVRGPLSRALAWGWAALAMTLASNLALAPVTVWYFGTFPPNFLLNLPWLPVQGLVVQVLGMLGAALAALPGLDGPTGVAAGWLLRLAALVQDGMLDALHAASASGLFPTWALLRPLWPELLGAATVLGAAPFCLRRGQEDLRAVGLVLAGLLLMAWPQARMLADEARDEVRLTLVDVGQAQALLVEGPGGVRALVDGGGSLSPTFDMGRAVVGPALAWGRPPRLDAVLMSHPDADHAQGLAWILRQIPVGTFRTNGRWPEGRLGLALDEALARGVNAERPGGALAARPMRAGERLELGPGLELEAVHPAEGYEGRGSNDNSLVLRLVWRGVPLALLPGDVQRAGIEDMLERGRDLRARALVLPHHGSKSSLSGLLYEAVAPELAVVSCGYRNMYRFPNRDVVAELAQRGVQLSGTHQRGMLRLVWRAPEAAPELSGWRDGPWGLEGNQPLGWAQR